MLYRCNPAVHVLKIIGQRIGSEVVQEADPQPPRPRQGQGRPLGPNGMLHVAVFTLKKRDCNRFFINTGTSLADSPGLAILVTCDYKNCPNPALKELKGSKVDAEEMKKTFDHLNYIVHQLENPTGAQITSLLKKVSEELSGYKGETELPKKSLYLHFLAMVAKKFELKKSVPMTGRRFL